MRITNFTISQDGLFIGNSTVREQTVNAATRHAIDTGKPVSLSVHVEGGGTEVVTFNPDGTNENIWAIDKGQPLTPTVGQVYTNRGGGRYRCIARMEKAVTTYFNPAGDSSDTSGIFRNVKSGWTFTAKGIIQYIDGSIEWNHSTDGRFEDIEQGE